MRSRRAVVDDDQLVVEALERRGRAGVEALDQLLLVVDRRADAEQAQAALRSVSTALVAGGCRDRVRDGATRLVAVRSARALTRRFKAALKATAAPPPRRSSCGAMRAAAGPAPVRRADRPPVRQVRDRRRVQHGAHVRRSTRCWWRLRRAVSGRARLGYFAGSLNSYVLNRHWTFRARDLAHTTAGPRFAIVQVFAIAANVGLLYLFVHDLGVHKILAQAILTVPVLAVTFFVNRAWSFADRAARAPPRS